MFFQLRAENENYSFYIVFRGFGLDFISPIDWSATSLPPSQRSRHPKSKGRSKAVGGTFTVTKSFQA